MKSAGSLWANYKAVNIVGKISCVNFEASKFTKIIDSPGLGAVPLVMFEDLKINSARAGENLLFRLAESPGVILVAASVAERLLAIHSDEEWGITLRET